MGFKRTPEGRVFFQGTGNGANDDTGMTANENRGTAAERKTAFTINDEPPRLNMKAKDKGAHSPQMRSAPLLSGEKSQLQIVTLLKTLNERLKLTQADRDNMMREMEQYRTIIEGLQEKADKHEKLAADLEDKLEQELSKKLPALSQGKGEGDDKTHEVAQAAIQQLVETRKLMADMERRRVAETKALNDKVNKGTASMQAMQKRIEQNEEKQSVTDEKIDTAMLAQSKLMHKVEKAIEDRARFMRKIERIEETVLQTRDSLNAKAMVLLADQGVAEQKSADFSDDHIADIESNDSASEDDQEDMTDLEAQIDAAIQMAKMNTEAALVSQGEDLNAPQNLKSQQTTQFAHREINEDALSGFDTPHRKKSWWKAIVTVCALAFITLFGSAIIYTNISPDGERGSLQNLKALVPSFLDLTTLSSSAPQPATSVDFPLQKAQPIETMEWGVETTEGLDAFTPAQQQAQILQEDDVAVTVTVTSARAEPDNIETAEQSPLTTTAKEQQAQVAESLNAIEPQKQTTEKVEEPIAALKDIEPVEPQVKTPSSPSPSVASQSSTIVSGMIQPDANLPNVVKMIEEQAFQGNAEAQHDLAAIYTAGHGGVQQNYDRAAFWFERASENGIANASYNLGVLYHQGLGRAPDIDAAIRWYQDAADQGHPEAQYNLGIAHIEGVGVDYDPVKSSRYFEMAARSGVIEAAYNLGLIYENGLLGEARPDYALMWYKEAADQGSPEARQALDDLASALNITAQEIDQVVEELKAQNQEQASIQAPTAGANVIQVSEAPVVEQPVSPSGSSAALDHAVVAQVQEYLMSIGLYPGPADGVGGALTQDAIRLYQTNNNLEATGKASPTLLSHMLQNTSEDSGI